MRRLISKAFAGIVCSSVCWVHPTLLLADTWRVGGEDADFEDLQDAVDAADPGDILLIRRGDYGNLTLDKPLTLKGVGRATVFAHDAVIRSLPPGTQTVIGDMTFRTLRAENNQGLLALSHLHVHSDLPWAMSIADCDSIVFEDLLSHATAPRTHKAHHTVQIFRSHGRVQGIRATGPNGRPGDSGTGENGGDALRLESSQMLISNAHLRGGAGGTSVEGFAGGSGGDAIESIDSRITIVDADLHGGNGGDGGVGGRGGNGLSTRDGVVCRVVTEGGTGGSPNGRDGDGLVGDPRVEDHHPSLRVNHPWNPGDVARITVQAFKPSDGFVLASTAAMSSRLDPIGWYLDPSTVWILAHSRLEVGITREFEFTIPEHHSLTGMALHLQARLITDAHDASSTPPAFRIVGEQ